MLSMLPDHIITKKYYVYTYFSFRLLLQTFGTLFLDSNHQKVVVCSIKFGLRNTDIYR